jgi:hypothetical protein
MKDLYLLVQNCSEYIEDDMILGIFTDKNKVENAKNKYINTKYENNIEDDIKMIYFENLDINNDNVYILMKSLLYLGQIYKYFCLITDKLDLIKTNGKQLKKEGSSIDIMYVKLKINKLYLCPNDINELIF